MVHWTDTFAPEDLEEIAAFLEATNRTQYDPNADGRNPDDVFFWLTREQIGLQTYAMRDARNRAGRLFRCYPLIVESPHPNAFARELDRVHVVGLNAGMATVAFELAAYALSRSDTFAGIGDPAKETSPPLPPGAMLGYWIFDRVSGGEVQESAAGSELDNPIGRILRGKLAVDRIAGKSAFFFLLVRLGRNAIAPSAA